MADATASNGWLCAIAAVLFDIDVGPTVSTLVPHPDALTAEEKELVAFHAFPDSMPMALTAQTSVRDSSFMFRVRRSPDAPALPAVSAAAQAPASVPTPATTTNQHQPRYLYGFVFCRQRTDPRLRRGGEQASVVVLSEQPLSAVLAPLADAAGPAFFGAGEPALRAAWDDACASWPARPLAGQRVRLPLPSLIPGGDLVVCARLPQFAALPEPRPAAVVAGVDAAAAAAAGVAARGGATAAKDASSAQQQQQQLSPTPSAGSLLSPQPSSANGSPAPAAAANAANATTTLTRYPSLASSSSRRRSRSAGGAGRPMSGSSTGSLAAVAAGAGAAATEEATPPAAPPQPPPQPTPFAAPLPPNNNNNNNNNSNGSGRGGSVDADAFSGLFGEYDASAVLCGAGGRHHPHHGRCVAAAAAAGANNASSSSSSANTAPRDLTKHAWLLWELAVTGAPLLVVAPTPTECSTAVAAAVSLCNPLPYSADFRPYYTIHDPSFRRLAAGELPSVGGLGSRSLEEDDGLTTTTDEGSATATAAAASTAAATAGGATTTDNSSEAATAAAPVPTVLGVTNLYVLKASPAWPNVLAVGVKESAVKDLPGGGGGGGGGGMGGGRPPSAGGSLAAKPSGGGGGGLLGALRRRQQGASQLLGQHTQGLWHQYRALTKPDPALLSSLAQAAALDARSPLAGAGVGGGGFGGGGHGAGGGGGHAHILSPPTPTRQARLFRRHFADLTLSLLAPYSRYLEPGLDGRVRAWRPEELLRDAAAPGAAAPMLLARVGGSAAALRLLHRRFMEGCNFAPWFAARRAPYEHLVEEVAVAAGAGGGGLEAVRLAAAGAGSAVPRGLGAPAPAPAPAATGLRGWLGGGGSGNSAVRRGAPGLATRVFSAARAAAAGSAGAANEDDEADADPDAPRDGDDEVALVQKFVSVEARLLRADDDERRRRRGGGGDGDDRASSVAAGRETEALQKRLAELFFRLPADARAALASSPARLALVKQAVAAAAGGCDGAGGGGALSAEECEVQLKTLSLLHAASGGGLAGGGGETEAAAAAAATAAAGKEEE